PQRAVRASRVPVHLDPINRKARWIVAGLVEHAVVGAEAFPMLFEVGQLAPQPALVEREHPGLVALRLLPHTGELADAGWHVDHREASTGGHCLRKGSV